MRYPIKRTRKIDYIVIHYFGALESAEQTCAFFKSVNRKASAHYFVDDNGVFQSVDDKNAAWHCGDGGAGQYKAVCKNANSIGIEVRPYKANPKSLLASDKDWYFHEATIANLTELVKSLMAAHGIDADHVIRHYAVTAKACPRPWVGEDINTYFGKTGNQLWAEFKASLEEENMEAWKTEIGEKALADGIITDKAWLDKLDEPAPVWMVLALANKLKEEKA